MKGVAGGRSGGPWASESRGNKGWRGSTSSVLCLVLWDDLLCGGNLEQEPSEEGQRLAVSLDFGVAPEGLWRGDHQETPQVRLRC